MHHSNNQPNMYFNFTQQRDFHTFFPSNPGHIRSLDAEPSRVRIPHLDPGFFFSAAPGVAPLAPYPVAQAPANHQPMPASDDSIPFDGQITRPRARRKRKTHSSQDGEGPTQAQNLSAPPTQRLPIHINNLNNNIDNALPFPLPINTVPTFPFGSSAPWPPPVLPPGVAFPPPPPHWIPQPPPPTFQRRKNQRGGDPRVSLLERPTPTPDYLRRATLAYKSQPAQPLLIILDLNGVLVHRRKTSRTAFEPRIDLGKFLSYLFAHHHVMVWSSGKAEYVTQICQRVFSKSQFESLIGIWSRDRLRLTAELSAMNVQVYKQLTWVWEDEDVQWFARNGTGICERAVYGGVYGQENTILIDDSMEKAAAEPFNLLEVDEFMGGLETKRGEKGTLMEVVEYLKTVDCVDNVSAFMRERPFKHAGKAP